MSGDFDDFKCDKCEARIKNHYWGKVKAEGWFFSRDNKVIRCPEHVPSWYHKWTSRRKSL